MNAATLGYYRDLLFVLVAKEFKVRYKSTFLGYVWSILNPLAFAAVYFFVFKHLVSRGGQAGAEIKNYALYLILGLFPWQWFANSVNSSNSFFLSNDSLIKKVRFPRAFLVLAGVLNDLIHFAVSIPVMVAFMLYYREYPSVTWLWYIPFLVGVQLLFTYSVALFIATCNLFFRDLDRLTAIFTLMWFFLTPVIYPIEIISERYPWGLFVNPMASLIVCWRSVFLEGRLPLNYAGSALAFSVVAYLIAQSVYRSLQWRFAEVV